MNKRKFIQDIIDNELTMCFADCSQDNIDKWVEILERYKEKLTIPVVVGALCDCEIPKPKDPYNDIDKHYCIDCENLIA